MLNPEPVKRHEQGLYRPFLVVPDEALSDSTRYLAEQCALVFRQAPDFFPSAWRPTLRAENGRSVLIPFAMGVLLHAGDNGNCI